jgi:hypothetical protein
VSFAGESVQVVLAATVRAAGKNLCDEVLLVHVGRNHGMMLTVLGSSRIDRLSGAVFESDTDDVVNASSNRHSRVPR